jgi:hypothetical protein
MSDNGPCNCEQALALQEELNQACRKLAELQVDLLNERKNSALSRGDYTAALTFDGWLDRGTNKSSEGDVRAFSKKIDIYSVKIAISSEKVYIGVMEDLGPKITARWFDYVHKVDPGVTTLVNIQTAVKAALTMQKTIGDVLQTACWNL